MSSLGICRAPTALPGSRSCPASRSARRIVQKPGDTGQQCRFPAARWPRKPDEVAPVNIKVQRCPHRDGSEVQCQVSAGTECLSDQPLTAPAAMLHANSLPETDQVISATSPVRMRGPEQPIRKPGEVVPEQRCRNRHAENRMDKDQAPQRAMTPGVAQQDHTTGCLAKAHRPAQRAGVLSHMTGDSPARVIKRSVAARVAAAGRPDGPFDGSATAMTSVPGPQAAGCASVRGLTLPPGQRSAF